MALPRRLLPAHPTAVHTHTHMVITSSVQRSEAAQRSCRILMRIEQHIHPFSEKELCKLGIFYVPLHRDLRNGQPYRRQTVQLLDKLFPLLCQSYTRVQVFFLVTSQKKKLEPFFLARHNPMSAQLEKTHINQVRFLIPLSFMSSLK